MRRGRRRIAGAFAALAATFGLLLAAVGGAAASGASGSGPESSPGAPAAPVVAPKVDCAALARATGAPDFAEIPGAPTRVSSAGVVAATADAPEYCDVKGYIAPQVQFELKLPTRTYQGRYLQIGCGGFCGSVPETTFPACRAQLGGDFAIAATNTGHVGAGSSDALWALNDRQLRTDLYRRGVHVLSLAAKAIIAAYYGQPPRYSYFSGCSEGGREALTEAQRFPGDFDGILAGAPAMYWAPLNGEFQPWLARVNTAADGSHILTPAKLPALHDAVIAACDARDGRSDGQIDDPRDCDFDPAAIACPAGTDRPTCLTPAQVEAVRRIYGGPVDPQGHRLYVGGEPYGSELAWAGWLTGTAEAPDAPGVAQQLGENYLRYMAFPVGTPGVPLRDWQFTEEGFDRLRAEGAQSNALNPDLGAFRAGGGKLILYHGWADQAIPPFGTPNYYASVVDRMGGLEATQRFARLFMFPAMYHCRGGYGPTPDTSDMILALVRWVEQGQAPTAFQATQRDAQGTVTARRTIGLYEPRPEDRIDWEGSDLLAPGAKTARHAGRGRPAGRATRARAARR